MLALSAIVTRDSYGSDCRCFRTVSTDSTSARSSLWTGITMSSTVVLTGACSAYAVAAVIWMPAERS